MALVTIFKTFSSAEAQLVRSRLDANGFPVHVTHELSALSIEGYAAAAGGIQVQVPEEVARDARALLDSTDTADPNEDPA